MSEEVVYRSNIQVERIKGPYRRVLMPVETEPLYFSTHSEIAEYYKHEPGVHPRAFDYDRLPGRRRSRLTDRHPRRRAISPPVKVG